MPEGTYLDTSFLLKAYVKEPDSPFVVRFLQQQTGRLLISHLTHVEIASSLYRKLPQAEAERALNLYRRNCASGAFGVLAASEAVFVLAASLAEQYSGPLRLRSLDLLHLATALQYQADSMATYDERLQSVSKAAGLTLSPTRP